MNLKEIFNLVEKKINLTEEMLRKEVHSPDAPIIARMGEYITSSGGKRIRPAVLSLSAGACGYSGDKDVRFGVVFELVHTATLIHDDIIDNADMRRGKTVLNRIHGSTIAILFGDYLFNLAMRIAIRDDDFRIVRLINQATAKMIEGEIIQLERNFRPELSFEEYYDLIRRKTAFVFAASAQAGALLGSQEENIQDSFFQYGLNLGIAFQIIDDYFDYISTSQKLGKPVGSDLKEGKITFPILKLYEKDKESKEIVSEIFTGSLEFDDGIKQVKELLKKHAILEETKAAATAFARKAAGCLDGLPQSRFLDALQSLPEFVVKREN